jgi:hypothetical protein
VNLTDNFVELYRYMCKMGTCDWYHAYSSLAKVSMPCCELEGIKKRLTYYVAQAHTGCGKNFCLHPDFVAAKISIA